MTLFALDDEIRGYVEAMAGFAAEGDDIASVRAAYEALCAHFARPHPAGLATRDLSLGGHSVRLYRPAGDTAPTPCIVWFHGGGWVVGSLTSHDSILADLASATGLCVLAVDYRLAPEHVYPAAIEDAWAVLVALPAAAAALGIDPDRLLVGGDSAGGNIAATVALRARDGNGPALCGQLLIYPALSGDDRLPSRTRNAEAPGLSSADMRHYRRLYLGRDPIFADDCDGLLHPASAASHAHLPPAFMTAAEHDPLRDDVPAYAAALRSDGVEVDAVIEPGLIHGWLRARHVSRRAGEAFAHLVEAAKRLASA